MILKQQVDHCISVGIALRGLALPRTRYIKHLNAIMLYERDEQERRPISEDLLCVNKLVRLALVDAKRECLLDSALNLAEIEDRRSIALENVTQGSLAVSTFFELGKEVTLWDLAVFSQASRWAPAAAGETPSEGGIQSAPVNTSLSSGEDLRQPHPYILRATAARPRNEIPVTGEGPVVEMTTEIEEGMKDLQEGSCDKTQQAPFSSNRKGPHRLFILSCDICQRQVTIDCQALFLSMPTKKLEFRADDPLFG